MIQLNLKRNQIQLKNMCILHANYIQCEICEKNGSEVIKVTRFRCIALLKGRIDPEREMATREKVVERWKEKNASCEKCLIIREFLMHGINLLHPPMVKLLERIKRRRYFSDRPL